MATSTDLITWQKHPGNPVLCRWLPLVRALRRLDVGGEAWRDPWVFADPKGDGWYMLITARANRGPIAERGVVGHAALPIWSTGKLDRH